jgi:hypothetical protein
VQQRLRLCGTLPRSAVATLPRKYLAWGVRLTGRKHSRPAKKNPARMASLPNLSGVTLLAGGFPITDGEVIAGGIAISGAAPDQDVQIGEAALAALEGRSRPFTSTRSVEEDARSGIDSMTQKVYVHSTPDADGGNSGRAVQPTPTGKARKRPPCRRSAFGTAFLGRHPVTGREPQHRVSLLPVPGSLARQSMTRGSLGGRLSPAARSRNEANAPALYSPCVDGRFRRRCRSGDTRAPFRDRLENPRVSCTPKGRCKAGGT